MRYIEFADRLIEQQIQDELSDRHRPRLTLRHLGALRRMREVRARDRARHLDLVNRMYGPTDEELDTKAATKDKWADGLGKVALQSVKTEDKYEEKMGDEALGRIKRS